MSDKPVLLIKFAKALCLVAIGYGLCILQARCNYNNDVIACDMPSFNIEVPQ